MLRLSVLAFFWTVLGYLLFVIFEKVHFIAIIMPDFFFGTNKNLIAYLVGYFCRILSTDSPQRRVRQKTEEDVAASRAKIMNRPVIPKRNVVRADIMVAP
jgi:hypothetical protein